MKTCTKCKETKNLTDFNNKKQSKDGYNTQCKICINKRNKEYREKLGDKFRERQMKYYYKNHDKVLELKHRYTLKTKDKKSEYDIEYRANNKEKIAAYKKEWTKNKLKTDIEFKLKRNLRRRVHHALKGSHKSDRTFNLIGCNISEFKKHIESQFQEGMTWENYGKEWHIDHIVPCFTFDLTDKEQQKICFHYSNQRPLWATDNLKRPKTISLSQLT